MTTIAFDGVMMAADSQQGGLFTDQVYCRKIERHGNNLIGFTGDLSLRRAMINWLLDGADPKLVPKGLDFNTNHARIIIANKKGVVEYQNDTGHPCEVGKIYATGSGAQYAMGALLAGANARQAVKIAIKLDPNSGGPIRTLSIKGKTNVRNNKLSSKPSTKTKGYGKKRIRRK